VEILSLDAKKLPKNEKFFDLIFLDPPYEDDYSTIIKNLLEKNWIQKNSLIVIEFQTTKEPKNFEKLKLLDFRKYGKSSFAFLQLVD
jgi:16S rRNA G966 N2-methylase RsmD